MPKYIKQDITTVTSGIVVHGCNCFGVMGSGVALAIKNQWPEAFTGYQAVCNQVRTKTLLLGRIHKIQCGDVLVINGFTQVIFGSDNTVKYANVDAIEQVLLQTFDIATATNQPVFLPKIGSLRGGLSWELEVEPMIKRLLLDYPNIDVTVCLWP